VIGVITELGVEEQKVLKEMIEAVSSGRSLVIMKIKCTGTSDDMNIGFVDDSIARIGFGRRARHSVSPGFDHAYDIDHLTYVPIHFNRNNRAEQVYLAQIERRRREEESDRVRTELDAIKDELERVKKVSLWKCSLSFIIERRSRADGYIRGMGFVTDLARRFIRQTKTGRV
jgi:hypothetical protein